MKKKFKNLMISSFISLLVFNPTNVLAKSKLKIEGKLQSRWEFSGDNNGWSDSFYVRRARVDTKWRPYDWTKLVLELELTDGVEAKDAYAKFYINELFNVSTGKFKKPFSVTRLESSWDLLIPERGLLDKNAIKNSDFGGFGTRELGVMFDGTYKNKDNPLKLSYYLGVFNNEPGDNEQYRDFVGRVEAKVIKGLDLAFNSSFKLYNEDNTIKNALLNGADIIWKVNRFKFKLEGALGSNIDNDSTLWGSHLTSSYKYKINDDINLIPAFMLEAFDPNTTNETDLQLRLAGALNLELYKKTKLVLAVDQTWNEQNLASTNPIKIQMQANLTF